MSENQCSKIVVEFRLIEEKNRGKLNKNMVGDTGLEPVTPCL